MNASTSRWMLTLLACSLALPITAEACAAAEGGGMMLQASLFYEIVGDRARMIQISLVVVACGCALLWWRR
jgi:hypothetical protein